MTRPASTPSEAYASHYPVIAPLIMSTGIGDGRTTSCVMAQAATIDALRKGLTLDAPTDEMECACPVLRRLAIRLNDTNWWKDDAERTEVLRPLIPMLLDSHGSDELTWRRAYLCFDNAARVLTPMRLEWISANTKNEKLKARNTDDIAALKALAPIVDKATLLAAREVCQKLRADASAYASAYAAYASADADAYASAYAYAYASAYAYAQKLKYRAALLQLFHDCAALK